MQRIKQKNSMMSHESRYRLLIDAITDYAVYMLDPDGIISSWNLGARRFKGYEEHEIVGQHFSKFYTDEDLAANLPARALHEAATHGKFAAEGWRVRKDGTRFWAYVIIDPIRNEHGRLIGFAKVTRDLTERKNAEAQLEQAREALAQSQKMEAIGRLTGGVAHDFNNLLMVIQGSLELLRKRLPEDPKLIALVDNAMQGTQRGASLTQRMLAFSRRQKLNFESVDVEALVKGMSDMLQRALGPEVQIETRFPPALPPVNSDVNQLESAILNLAVNAKDAMPTGGVITIRAREERVHANEHAGLKPGTYVCLSVEDTGHGMDMETLSRAPEPFFTTKGPGKGTGLGLAMVHGVATQSGGKLTIKSQLFKGSTIEIWLPAVAMRYVAPPDDDEKAARRLKAMKVLVVDDDPLVLTNTQAMLDDLDNTVITAYSAHEALDIINERKDIDLVITDHAMPAMTGSELLKIIKEKWPKLPVIIATGYDELPPDASPVLPKLLKPYTQAQMVRAIAEAVR